jgi:hypothetical protein
MTLFLTCGPKNETKKDSKSVDSSWKINSHTGYVNTNGREM